MNVKEIFDKVRTKDIELKTQYILNNMDVLWFGKPVEVLEELSELEGVTAVKYGNSWSLSAGIYVWNIRIDPSRPSLDGMPRNIPQAVICNHFKKSK